MMQLKVVSQFFNRHIWEINTRQLPRWQARGVGAVRIIYLLIRDLFFDSQLTLQAMSLVYTTLLALVPLIAVSVSVLKGFGVHNQIEPALLAMLEPLGKRGVEITQSIIQFVNNINSGLLGSVGLALLLYTVITLMQKIEQAFNHTWRVTEERSFAQRFSDYLSVILIGPVLVFSAIGLTASFSNSTLYQKLIDVPLLAFLVNGVSHILPFLLVILAFTLIYIFIPNTKVRLKSALVGATVAGVLWQGVGWVFTYFVANANYTAIYSAFAALFFFMIWLYASWTILLTGASLAYYFQNPAQRLRERRTVVLSNRMKEKLALAVMALTGKRFYQKETALTLNELSHHLNLASDSLQSIINALINHSLLIATADEPHRFVPAQAPEQLSLQSILDAVRSAEEDSVLNLRRIPTDNNVEHFFALYQDAAAAVLSKLTLKDLVEYPQPVTDLNTFDQKQA